jgi:hypothetical protein
VCCAKYIHPTLIILKPSPVDIPAGEVNVNMYVKVQREKLIAEAPRRTKAHKVCVVVVIEQFYMLKAKGAIETFIRIIKLKIM